MAVRRRLRVWLWPVVAVTATAFVVELSVTRAVPSQKVAADLTAAVREVQEQLGTAASSEDLRDLLVAGGAEAEPEQPFDVLAALIREIRVPVDSSLLVDERGSTVAWVGPRSAVPMRLRALGERTVGVEPGLDEVWIWWREPLFESGRPRGAILVGVALSEVGERRPLGVWVGSSAVAVPELAGGEPVRSSSGARLLGVETAAARPVIWLLPGGAALLLAVAMAIGRALAPPVAVALALPAVVLAGPSTSGWPLVLLLVVVAWLVGKLPDSLSGRLTGAVTAAALVAGLAQASLQLPAGFAPTGLLWPGLLPLALLWALAVVLRRLPAAASAVPWPVTVATWAVPVAGLWLGNVTVAALGLAIVTAWGFRPTRAILPALAAALALLTVDASLSRSRLVDRTEESLRRIDGIEQPAQMVLEALPEGALDGLAQLEPREQLVVLGRLASWIHFEETLPGCTLAMYDVAGRAIASWGEVPQSGETPRELAERELVSGGRLVVLAPPGPHDVLAALAGPPPSRPVAVFGRSGAPIGRGATFRPLSSVRVGQALARGRSWGTVGVGERELKTYLRARQETVVAVPWVRPPLPDTGLLLAALALWATVPTGLAEVRRRASAWWRERRTLTGRLRLVSVGITLVPLLLLGNLLPRQWSRQRQSARLELARVVSEPLSRRGSQRDLGWLVRDLGGVVTLYEGGVLVRSTHPDLAVTGQVPWLAPRDAYVRAVRGWFEPIVEGTEEPRVFAAVPGAEVPTVVGVTGLRQIAAGGGFLPGEWFLITGIVGLLLAVAVADRLGERLTRPLNDLVGAVRRLERGEAVEGLETPSDEEVALLARSFTTMAQTVRGREDELRRERDLLGEVLETLSAAVIVARAGDGGIELANSAALGLLGGADQLDSLSRRFGKAFSRLVDSAVGGARASETVRPDMAPESVWRVTAVPLPAGAERLLLVLEDLSEVARVERLASLAELARIVAHEVKNPLTPIRLWAEEVQAALEQGRADVAEVARVAAEQILERVGHLHEVAQGFSNLVALERWQPETVNLAELSGEVAAEYGVLAQRGISVEMTIVGDTSVRADPQWLRRSLRHLLENSVRAIGQHGGAIRVGVTGEASEVVLSVRDTGGGVADEHLGRLFEPHFSTTSNGTGLGLAVVERVATRAGGSASARNVEGGLEVRLVFPHHRGS